MSQAPPQAAAPASENEAVRFLTEVCRAAVRQGASDIHVKVGQPPMIRSMGEIKPVPGAPRVTAEMAGAMAWNIMTAAQRDRFKTTNELDMAWAVPGIGRFRVNVFRQRQNIGLVMRLIPTVVKTIDELNLPPVIKNLALTPRGLILVTGTTGSGKSTTLAAMVDDLNTRIKGQIGRAHV